MHTTIHRLHWLVFICSLQECRIRLEERFPSDCIAHVTDTSLLALLPGADQHHSSHQVAHPRLGETPRLPAPSASSMWGL